MTVSINTRTWVEVSEVISSKTSNKATLGPTQLVTDQYNLWLKRKIQPEVEATSAKPQAASDTTCGCVDNFKKDLTAGVG